MHTHDLLVNTETDICAVATELSAVFFVFASIVIRLQVLVLIPFFTY